MSEWFWYFESVICGACASFLLWSGLTTTHNPASQYAAVLGFSWTAITCLAIAVTRER